SPDGDIAEDQMAASPGSYSATAQLNSAGPWIMQMVAFRTARGSISCVQRNYATPQAAETTVAVPFTAAQAEGDLNVIVVGWNGSKAAVSAVTDKSGNTYLRAAGPTLNSGSLSQSIYYAKNIAPAAAGANTVTVTFSTAAAYPDIRILEYSGVDLDNPVDITAASSGAGATSSSGAATTTNPADLIFGANIVTTSTAGPASGFTQRLLTSPDGDIAEDQIAKAPGSYGATAPLSSSGLWIMQMVAFRAASGGGIAPPTTPSDLKAAAVSVGQINLNWAASTSSMGLVSYQVERCQGAGCTNFTQIATPAGTTYNNTGLAPQTNYSYRVRAADAAGNVSPYSNVVSATTLGAVASTIAYIQSNYATPQTAQTAVNVAYRAAQAAGDLNVVIVGWNDSTATVSSVSDSSGNTYARAAGPTTLSGSLSQSIYYAKNIASAAAGANAVTVRFSTAATNPDIRILEYSGADPNNPVDVTAASSGNSSTSNSGAATTTSPADLIVGANMVFTSTAGPGSGFTQRLLTSPDGDIAEDQMAASPGSYSATAQLNSAGPWIMQMVAFRTVAGTGSGSSTDPQLVVSPASFNFGSVMVSSTSSHVFTLSVTGAGNVTISQATAVGSGFTISGLTLPLTLAAGQSAAFGATFSPTASGAASGGISIVSNASNSVVTVSLSGTGTTQSLSASPSSLNFGDVVIGSSSILPVVVTNTGSASVTISQAALTGAGFSVRGPALPLTLPTGQNTSFSVTFDPASTGAATGNLSFVSNAPGSGAVTSLSATGVNKHSVALTWTTSSSPNVTGYNIYRGTVSGGPYTKLNSSVAGGTAYTDTTVQAGQTYFYVTTAVNSQGMESADSNQATAAISAP
ncbi:MAG: choice-of-anchor D domain-containing protein, partial [Terriglobia bacterium]